MILRFPSPEFDEVVAAVCHGSPSEAEMRALNLLLRGNPSARDEYLLRVELHSRLASDPDLFSPVEATPLPLRAPGQSLDNRNQVLFPAPKSRAAGKRLVQVLALAAGVCVGW